MIGSDRSKFNLHHNYEFFNPIQRIWPACVLLIPCMQVFKVSRQNRPLSDYAYYISLYPLTYPLYISMVKNSMPDRWDSFSSFNKVRKYFAKSNNSDQMINHQLFFI